MLGRILAMGQFTDARGQCLFDSLGDELYDFNEGVPYPASGDDGLGYSECRLTYDENIEPQVSDLTYRLEKAGCGMAALGVRRAFDAVAAECNAIDAWYKGNPPPDDIGDKELLKMAFNAVGDPDGDAISACYEELRRAKAAVVPDATEAKIKIDPPTLAIVRAIEAGKRNGDIAMELGTTPGNVAKVKSYHKHGRYTI